MAKADKADRGRRHRRALTAGARTGEPCPSGSRHRTMTITVNSRTIAITVVAALAILAAYLIGSARPSVAGAASPTVLTASTGSPADTGITVTGTGKVTGTPDTLRISMSVTATNQDVDTALASANKSAKAVQDALLAKGVEKKDLQTSNVSIWPNYNSKGAPKGYTVTESLTASVRDITKAGATLSAAVDAGGNAVRVDAVSFALEDTDGLVPGARKGAVEDAKAKAEQYAAAAGRSLGAVQSISEVVTSPNPQYMERQAYAVPAALSAVPLQAGSQDLTVQVTVVYALS